MKLSYLIVGVLLGILAIAAIRYVPELFVGSDEILKRMKANFEGELIEAIGDDEGEEEANSAAMEESGEEEKNSDKEEVNIK